MPLPMMRKSVSRGTDAILAPRESVSSRQSAVQSRSPQSAVQSAVLMLNRVVVTAASGPYCVVIGDGAIDALRPEMDAQKLGARRLLIASQRVWDFHGP